MSFILLGILNSQVDGGVPFGTYVITGNNGKVATSPDGITWTLRTGSWGTGTADAVGYGDGLFVAAAQSNIHSSPDGITWTNRVSFNAGQRHGVAYDTEPDGLWVVVGRDGGIRTSPDTITWTARTSGFGTSGDNSAITKVAYGDELFIAVGAVGKLATSTDGITWTLRTSGTTGQIRSIAYGDGLWVFGNARVNVSGVTTVVAALHTSTDGTTWTQRSAGITPSSFPAITHGNGLFVASAAELGILSSPDGITWTARTSGFGASTVRGLFFGDGQFVAVGESGKLSTSPDAITWTLRTSGFSTTNINSVSGG